MEWTGIMAVHSWEEGWTAAHTLGPLDVWGPGDDEKPANGAEEHPAEETQCREGIGQKSVADVAPAASGGLPTGFGSVEVEEDQDLRLMREHDGKVWTQ